MKQKTLIFDIDGTLVEAKQLHHKSFEWAVQQQHPEFTISTELANELEGIPSLNKIEKLQNIGLKLDPARAYRDKQHHTNLHLHMLSWNKNLPKIINELSNTYNIALASNARSQFVYKVISIMELTQVDIILTANFVPINLRKPSPYIFNMAMQLLNAEPEQTTIFEDSEVGLLAARSSRAKNIIKVNNSDDTYNYLEKLL